MEVKNQMTEQDIIMSLDVAHSINQDGHHPGKYQVNTNTGIHHWLMIGRITENQDSMAYQDSGHKWVHLLISVCSEMGCTILFLH